MWLVKKSLVIVLLCIILTCTPILPSISKCESQTSTFEIYSTHLSKNVFPHIKEMGKKYSKDITQEEANYLTNTIFAYLVNYFSENDLKISRPPLVQLFKLSNGVNIAVVLKIQISFVDKDESFKDLSNTIIFNKKFLIFFSQNSKGVRI